MKKREREKLKQVFDDIGAYIRGRVEKYRGSVDEDGKMLYQAYLGLYRGWQEVGFEDGLICHIDELK